MANQRIEVQHYEPDQIRAWLNEAVEILTDTVPPSLVTPQVFVKVLELLAAKTIQEVRFVPPDLIAAPAGAITGGGRGH